ncbi:hypothetical protein [Noviherbaspirillum sp.]|uniref:hypothetical protein n=1 Tax=Noviherbaspirillum sp. TaxID=1926288 RepID=UPI002B4A45CE|nr:hypothetical protein [Noviherbaspirillum sp.]HJV80757.1 hypothetical protein [Noviherbaspirillum sp.]
MTIQLNLNDDQKQQVLNATLQSAQTIRNSAPVGGVSGSDTFVYFAAFDGTNNDLANSGNQQTTNVAELWKQYLAEKWPGRC